MSKRLVTPASRLICFGGAKACTHAGGGTEKDELQPDRPYNP